jgi:hypothetical protein
MSLAAYPVVIVDVAYEYQTQSALRRDELHLATSGGVTETGPAPPPANLGIRAA